MNDFLQTYFSTTWLEGHRALDQYTYSGWSLINAVQDDEWVIDVGCGTNPFREHIKNLYGIDITNVGCDEQVSIEHFEPAILFDVAFCLGSINFGTEEVIHNQIKKIVSILEDKARIYWRCNPGKADHNNEQCKDIDFFPWSIEYHEKWSKEFGFRLQHVRDDHNRIYAEWVR